MKKTASFRDIPVMISDEIEDQAKMLVLELKTLSGLPFVLRKSRYGVQPSQYRAVISLNGALDACIDPNVIHVSLPKKSKVKRYGVTGREQLALEMREFAERIHNAYFS